MKRSTLVTLAVVAAVALLFISRNALLHGGAKRGQKMFASLALMLGADKNGYGGDGATPLIAAAEGGSLGVVERLIAAKADINRKHRDTGATALMVAAGRGKGEIVDALLAADAALDIRDNNDRTAYSYAFQTNQFEVAKKVRYVASVVVELPTEPTSPAIPKERGDMEIVKTVQSDASEQAKAQRRAAAAQNKVVSDAIQKAEENRRRRGH